MADFIPKISYGSGPTVITLSLPPEGDPIGESITVNHETVLSNNGTTQTQYNYTDQIYNVNFVFLTSSELSSLRTFFDDWAKLGKVFNYSIHSDSISYVAFYLNSFEFNPKRAIADGSGDFYYDLSLSFRRAYE